MFKFVETSSRVRAAHLVPYGHTYVYILQASSFKFLDMHGASVTVVRESPTQEHRLYPACNGPREADREGFRSMWFKSPRYREGGGGFTAEE